MSDQTTHTPATSDDGVEMIRSEERLRVHTERVPERVARLEKFVVTEQRTITVEVRHEEVRLVYTDLPVGHISAGSRSVEDRVLPDLVLSQEQIEVRTVVVPVERVRLVVDTVTEQQEVSDTVRQERIVAEQKGASSPSARIH